MKGLSATIAGGWIDAFHIEIGPGRWKRSNTAVEDGITIITNLLQSQYSVGYIARDDPYGCPTDKIWPRRDVEKDIKLSSEAVVKHLTWAEFTMVMNIMATNDYDCNFFFTKGPLYELVKEYPLDSFMKKHPDRNKYISGSTVTF